MPFICIPTGALETNCYLVYDGNKKGVVVDPGGDAPIIIDKIKEYNLHIIHVILTHVHFDHIMAANEVLSATGADLLVPGEDEPALSDSNLNLMHFSGNEAPTLKANRLLFDGDVIKAGELIFNVLHTPGHTKGSCCYISEDLLISGDTLFAGGIGRTDFPGGDSAAIFRSLKRLSQMEGDYTVLPGHGPSTTLSAEQSGNPYMNTSDYDFNY